jgi:oligoribonuclease
MRYLSLDLETTGLDGSQHQILEIAAVVENTRNVEPLESLPYYHAYVMHDTYFGEAMAFAMNSKILHKLGAHEYKYGKVTCLNEGENYVHIKDLWAQFKYWLDLQFNKKVTLAGKNVGAFDLPFLRKIPGFQADKFRHRVLDPGMLFIDWSLDEESPSMSLCGQRANLGIEGLHEALFDARMVIKLLRSKIQ